MEFSFFLKDNKSGYKTREGWLEKNHPQTYKSIIDYCSTIPLSLSFKEKIWFYFHNLTERPKCLSCGKEVKFRNRFDKPYGDFCSLKCANDSKDILVDREKQTFQEKYGVDFYPQHKEFIKKQKRTKKEKYGDENYNNLEKGRKTKKERYGDENYCNVEKGKITNIRRYSVDNYSKSNHYQNRLKKEYKEIHPTINFKEIKKDFVVAICNDCGKEYEITKQLLYERDKRGYIICTHCNPIGNGNRSGYEKQLSEFLNSLNIEHQTNIKIGDDKIEVDIFIPKYNVAIEINGVYWHNELFKSKDFHLNKTIQCQNKGIQLIHIFEDEWVYKKDIVKSIIKNRLGLTERKIYGRNCEIKMVSHDDSKTFLNENHVQGNVNSSVRIGLYYNDELVSVMSFSKGRIIMGGKENEWELNRFCNKINTTVIGASSKLLKLFIKEYNPQKIVSYSDIRLFDGGMYEKLGFNWVSQSKPNYWYVLNGIRQHRFKYNKKNLIKEGFDKNKTEKEIMFKRKIYRIYDCGNVRWELTRFI